LLAGRGRRLGSITKQNNKCLIKLFDKPLLGHIIDRLLFNNLSDIIPIVGYHSQTVINYLVDNYAELLTLSPIINPKFEETNNMYSLWCAREILDGNRFILCNGDSILNKYVIKKLINSKYDSAIVLDTKNKHKAIDSPGTIVKNGRIFDIGRHIPRKNNGGYAIGLYKYGKNLSSAYFKEVEIMLEKNMYQAGFHDPLITLFKSNFVYRVNTEGLSYTEIDTKEDILKANSVLNRILSEEND